MFQIPALALLLPFCLAALARQASSPKQAALAGFWTAALACGAALYWVVIPVRYFGNLPWALALPCPVLLGMYMGCYGGAFAAAMHWGQRRLGPVLLGLFAGAVWAGLELARSVLLTGFPWLSLGSAFVPWPAFIQPAAIIGEYGLGGLLAACAVWAGQFPKSRTAPALGVGLMAALAIFGFTSLSSDAPETAPTARISIVQGNIDQSLKWDRSFQQTTVDKYVALTRREIAENNPNLVIWPETALPFYFQDPSILTRQVSDLARRTRTPILTGAPAYAWLNTGPGAVPTMYNRAYLLNREGRITARYDKEHLVPFGEYIPYTDFLPLPDTLSGLVGNFSPGTDPSPLRASSLALGMLICYEAIFPELAQDRVAAGANLLVNISNDAWFGRSSAPMQHLHMSAMRAVEQNRYLIRGTNAGISAVIDNRGRIIDSTPLFEGRTLFSGRVPLLSATTPYHDGATLIRLATTLLPILMILAGLLFFPGERRTPVPSPTHKHKR